MEAIEFIRQIRNGQDITPAAVKEFIQGVADGSVPDYQATAYLMAVFLKGLSDEATVATTLAMRDSGRVIDLSRLCGSKVDKHSTGGVGDKVSIPLAPLVASCGLKVPMISGRGLGHTGGTLDKLESIPGFSCAIDGPRFVSLVDQIGFCLAGQTADLVPADKKLYALRDVTATVESIPLITASILSKKLAEGIDSLVLDVKVGSGAFMKDEGAARELAQTLVRVGSGAGLNVTAFLTRMEQPLGSMVGNALEVRESIDILQGVGPADSTELTLVLGAEMLVLGEIAANSAEAREMMAEKIKSGQALAKFQEIIEAQGGDSSVVDDLERLPQAPLVTDIISNDSGYISEIDAYGIGTAATALGAGRAKADDVVDPAVGIELLKKCGEKIEKNTVLARVHHRKEIGTLRDKVRETFVISKACPKPMALVIDRIRS